MAKKVPSSAAVKEYFRVNGPNWYNDISYGLNTIKNYAGNVYVSLQASNLNHLPDEVDSLWWSTISGGKGASIVRAPVAEDILKGDLLAWNTSGQFIKAESIKFEIGCLPALRAFANKSFAIKTFLPLTISATSLALRGDIL
jgi:hypothetical protein